MSYHTKVAYPPPPPTTNSLTSHQRTQLLRTTQKLGRILGTTPALIEESESMPSMLPVNLQRLAVPLHVQLSSVYDDGSALDRYPSSDSGLSSSSSSDHSHHRRTRSVHQNESWPKLDRPFLRINATKRHSKLEAIPQSPPAYSESFEPPQHTSFTIPASRAPAPAHLSAPPPFAEMPSATSVRRQKMDRLRRTLGEGVPLDLVFPQEETYPVPPYQHSAPPYNPQQQQQQRIRSARDSLVVAHGRPLTPRSEKKLSIIAEREEPYAQAQAYPPSPSDSASTDSERYLGDSEGDSSPSTYYYPAARRVKRVPVPSA